MLRIGLLFGGAVTRRANGGLRGVFRSGEFARITPGVGCAEHLGNAEVSNLHPAGFVEQEILRLDVAMNDAPVVGKLQGVAQRRHDGQGLFWSEFSRPQELAQVHTIHKFHQQIIKSAGLSKVVNGDDVRMVQSGQCLRLACETLGKFRVKHPLWRKEFECDEAV